MMAVDLYAGPDRTVRAPWFDPPGWSDIGLEEQVALYLREGPFLENLPTPRAFREGTEVVMIGHAMNSKMEFQEMTRERRRVDEFVLSADLMVTTFVAGRVRVADPVAWAHAFDAAVDVQIALREAAKPVNQAHVSEIAYWPSADGLKILS